MSDFETEYFIQTRKEVDTEKVERNKFLYLLLIVFGGAYGLVFKGLLDNFEKLSQICTKNITISSVCYITIGSLCFALPILIFITSIFKARVIRQKQIADRWETLHNMLTANNGLNFTTFQRPLEAIVIEGLQGKRYLKEDKAIFRAIVLMTYIPLVVTLGYISFNLCNNVPFAIGIIVCVSPPVKNGPTFRRQSDPPSRNLLN